MGRDSDEPGPQPGPAGEMRSRLENFDWAATPLGPRDSWSPSLTWSVDLMLASGFPMAVRWGPDLIQIYNDAYAGVLDDKHPRAFGRPTREVWPEIFDQLGALNHAILRGERPAFFADDYLWRVRRHGIIKDARFTISYSPVPDPTAPHSSPRIFSGASIGTASRKMPASPSAIAPSPIPPSRTASAASW